VSRGGPTVVLNGHLHVRDACTVGPVLQLSFAALVEHPFECSVVELNNLGPACRITREAISLHEAPANRDAVFVPATERWDFDGARWLSTHSQ